METKFDSALYASLLSDHPALGSLKLFQLAYRLGATAVSLGMLRGATAFACTGFPWNPDLESFFHDFPAKLPTGLLKLGEACWLGLAPEGQTVELVAEGEGQNYRLVLDHRQVLERESSPITQKEGATGLSVRCIAPVAGFVQETVATLNRLRATWEARDRLNCYPIPANFDGEPNHRAFELGYFSSLQRFSIVDSLARATGQGYPDREAYLVSSDEQEDHFAALPPFVTEPTELYINNRQLVLEKLAPKLTNVYPTPKRLYQLRHPELSMGLAQKLVRVPDRSVRAPKVEGALVVRLDQVELEGMGGYLLDECKIPRHGLILDQKARPMRVRRLILKEHQLGMESRVVPVLDGVQLTAVRCPEWGPGRLEFVTCPPHLATDASGLSLSGNRELRDWLETLATPQGLG